MKEMRRIERKMSDEKTKSLLKEGEYGILSTVNRDNHPYGVPVSYVVLNDAIYFHCATVGTKLDNILNNSKVCFTIVGRTRVLPDKFSTEYESVIVFGQASIIENENEKIQILHEIIKKYSPDFLDEGLKYIKQAHEKTKIVKIKIDHFSGKNRV